MRISSTPTFGDVNHYSDITETQILTKWTIFWGYVQNVEYCEHILDPRPLRGRTKAAVAEATPDMIQRTWHEIEYCPDTRRATNGAHIEPYESKIGTSDIS